MGLFPFLCVSQKSPHTLVPCSRNIWLRMNDGEGGVFHAFTVRRENERGVRSELFLCHLKGALKTIQAARHFGGCVLWCGGKIPGWLALNRPGSLNHFEFWDGGLSAVTLLLTRRVLLPLALNGRMSLVNLGMLKVN